MDKPNDVPKPNPRNTISLKIAREWTNRWRKVEGNFNAHHECNAFNIPLKDLTEVIKEEGVVSVRGYLGVEKKIEKGETVYEEKLIIVGVNAQGKDMLPVYETEAQMGDPEFGDIYDFSRPCPDVCDDGSPLNGGN